MVILNISILVLTMCGFPLQTLETTRQEQDDALDRVTETVTAQKQEIVDLLAQVVEMER